MTLRPKLCLLLLTLLLWWPPGAARSFDDRAEIDGLVLDQTRTKAGHDLFCRFSALWEPPGGTEPYTIVVGENVNPQWGSWIWVKVGDLVVFRSVMKPRDAEVKDLARRTVEAVTQYVTDYLRDGAASGDQDLAGSGW